MELWIVGQWLPDLAWEMMGVFHSEELAEAACKDDTYFVGPLILNEVAPDERTPWPGAYYPKSTKIAKKGT